MYKDPRRTGQMSLSAQVSQKQDGRTTLYATMKAMCSAGYHHNIFVATHALGHKMYN